MPCARLGSTNRIGKTLGNGVTTGYERDDASQALSLVTPHSSLAYAYNAVGNRVSKAQSGTSNEERGQSYNLCVNDEA